MNRISCIAVAITSLVISACAHPINVSPEVSFQNSDKKNDVYVGYYIPSSELSLEVTTPGGGGDNVRYYPYRDIEAGFMKMLATVFTHVENITLPSLNDKFDYIITPLIITNSGGSGFFTWPPTNFSVDLTSDIRDSSGTLVASPRVIGIGAATTEERIFNHGIAGIRAMGDALTKMQASLKELNLQSKSKARTSKAKQVKTGFSSGGI